MVPTKCHLPLSSLLDQVDECLDASLADADAPPTHLHRAMRHAVFPGGKRIRPRLLLSVFSVCAGEAAEPELAMAGACAIELVHSASLVHDDLPCFDNADERRGRPTVHALFGEAMAVLAGDALLTRAFELIADTPSRTAVRALRIARLLGSATGSRTGIIGGQSLEELPLADATRAHATAALADPYAAMKTAPLFRLAAEVGTIAAGSGNETAWAELGQCLGVMYQLADDLCDVCGSRQATGKPVHMDAALGRPNVVLLDGPGAVRARLSVLANRAREQAVALAAEPGLLIDMLDDLAEHFIRPTVDRSEEVALLPAG
jgi:geranylgeranyl diphosphate synthase type II